MATTYRVAMRAACFGLLSGFKTANPSLLQNIFRSRPGSLNPPFGYVDMAAESLTRTAQLRQRNPRARIFLGAASHDNQETADKEDILVDTFLDYAEAHMQDGGPGTFLQLIGIEDPVELTIVGSNGQNLLYPAIPFLMEGLILEGR